MDVCPGISNTDPWLHTAHRPAGVPFQRFLPAELSASVDGLWALMTFLHLKGNILELSGIFLPDVRLMDEFISTMVRLIALT